jgi:hypothetical protein
MSLLLVSCFLFFLFEKRVIDDLQRVLGDDGTHLIARLPSQGSSRIMSIGRNGTGERQD